MNYWMTHAIGVLGWVIPTSLQASVLVILVLLVQAALRRRLTPRWSYALWFVVVARLLMPIAPSSSFSVFNLLTLPDNLTSPMITLFEHQALQPVQVSPGLVAPPSPTARATDATPLGIPSGDTATSAQPSAIANANTSAGMVGDIWYLVWSRVAMVWIAGMLVFGGCMALSNVSLLRRVRRCRPVTNPAILNELEDCKERLGVTTPIAVVAVEWDRGPALFGWLRPRILIPHSLVVNPDALVLHHVFLHEVAHHKRHDIVANWITSILLLVHWFNPVLWLAFYRMRTDRELACDALALSSVDADEAGAYGNTILALLDRTHTFRSVPGVVGIVEGKSALKRRISMIALFKRGSYRWSVLALTVLAVFACVGLTGARTRAQTEPAPAPQTDHNVATAESLPGPVSPQLPLPSGAPSVNNPTWTGPTYKPMQRPKAPEWAADQMENAVSLEFEDIHLRDALVQLGESTDLNFVIDTRVVHAEGESADSKEGAELPRRWMVTKIQLHDVSIRGALSALLRPMELDYAFEDGYIWISSPAMLAAEGMIGQIGTRSGDDIAGRRVRPEESRESASRETPDDTPLDLDQNNLKQLGLVLKMYANESQRQMYPPIDDRIGRIIMDQESIYPEYLSDPKVLASPWAKPPAAGNVSAYFDDTSYWYIPYATQEEAEGLKFVETYRAIAAKGLALPAEVDVQRGGAQKMRLLQEGIERFYITDIHDPAQGAKQQSAIPVIIGRPRTWPDGKSGGNVLYMDGHVEFVEYPGKYPMTEKFIGALVGLDGIENESGSKPAASLSSPRFQARWVVENYNAESIAAIDKNGEQFRLGTELLFSETDVALASVAPEVSVPLSYRVNVKIKDDAAERLMEATGKNVGRKLAILFDGTVVCAPVVRDAIGSDLVVTGSFSKKDADALAWALTSGKSE